MTISVVCTQIGFRYATGYYSDKYCSVLKYFGNKKQCEVPHESNCSILGRCSLVGSRLVYDFRNRDTPLTYKQNSGIPTPGATTRDLILTSLLLSVVHVAQEAGFRAGRSTTEQIFKLRILYEKYLQHQQDLYHIFTDFNKAFDRVRHATL